MLHRALDLDTRNLKEREHLKDIGVGGRILLKWILNEWGGVTWIDLAQDRDMWRAVVKTVMNFQFL